MSTTSVASGAKRRLIVHDAVAFLSLLAITLVLLAGTLLLFRSFVTHRLVLAVRAAARGEAALAAGHPGEAIAAYRLALSYKPGEPGYERMLAQALANAGRTEEAYNYFLELWEVHPGDGSINLQLARLAVIKQETQAATNYYRASIYGTWEGDGVERRRAVRLELARYLIVQHQPEAARTELLVVGGNGSDDLPLDRTLAKLLAEAGAPSDALNFYRKVLAHSPEDAAALHGAAELSFQLGQFATAEALLTRAMRVQPSEADQELLHQTKRMLQLAPLESLPERDRGARVVALREIAGKRLKVCAAQAPAWQMQPLMARWDAPVATVSRIALSREPEMQAAALQLAYDTESQTRQFCGQPAGDDALVLLLAHSARSNVAPGVLK